MTAQGGYAFPPPVFEAGERVGCIFPGEFGTVVEVRGDGNARVDFDHVRQLRKLGARL